MPPRHGNLFDSFNSNNLDTLHLQISEEFSTFYIAVYLVWGLSDMNAVEMICKVLMCFFSILMKQDGWMKTQRSECLLDMVIFMIHWFLNRSLLWIPVLHQQSLQAMRSIILLSLRINNHLFLTKEVKKNYYWDMSPFSTSSKRKKWSRDLLVILLLSGDAADRNFIVKKGGVSLYHTSAVNENRDDYDFSIPVRRRCGQFSRAGRWHQMHNQTARSFSQWPLYVYLWYNNIEHCNTRAFLHWSSGTQSVFEAS